MAPPRPLRLCGAKGLREVGRLRFLEEADGFSAVETGGEFVPVGDFGFAEFPAEVDVALAVAVVVAADEIDQAGLVVFKLDADFIELIDEVGQAIDGGVEVFLDGGDVFGSDGGFHSLAMAVGQGVGFDDVGDDALNKREGLIGLLEGESPGVVAGGWSLWR